MFLEFLPKFGIEAVICETGDHEVISNCCINSIPVAPWREGAEMERVDRKDVLGDGGKVIRSECITQRGRLVRFLRSGINVQELGKHKDGTEGFTNPSLPFICNH